MSWSSEVRERVRALFLRDRMDREAEEEMRDHIARDADARARAGSTDPHREALAAFGGVERAKEEVREARGVLLVHDTVADLRYALRALRRNVGFSVAVVAILSIAIGASTAVLGVVNRVLFSALPYPESDRLVRVYQKYGNGGLGTVSAVDIMAATREQKSFTAFGGVRPMAQSLSGAGTPERIRVPRATAGFMTALGVRPAAGRLIETRDETPGAPAVVVLSYGLALNTFGSAQQAIGRAVTLDGVSHEIVGVLESGRTDLGGIRGGAWVPMQLETQLRRAPAGYFAYARLRDGVTLEQATADLAGISVRLFPAWSESFKDSLARMAPVPLRTAMTTFSRDQLALFAGAVILVLLIAVANVATLMLVRANAREHELTVRTVLGAGRSRLARLVVVECLLLGGIAGAIGLTIAAFGLRFVGDVAPSLPRLREVAFDASMIGFGAVLAVVCGLLVSIAPLSAVLGRKPLRQAPASGSPSRTGPGRRAAAVRRTLVIAEFALALPLLVGAGLLLNSFARLTRVDTGFDASGMYAVDISVPQSRYPDRRDIHQFWRRVEAGLAETPGIRAVGLTSWLPPDTFGDVQNFELLDKPTAPGAKQPVCPWMPATPGYLATLGARLVDGRWFTAGDTVGAPDVVVVSKAWASKFYPGENVIGKQMNVGGCLRCPPVTVIGVVSDVPYRGLGKEMDAVYLALYQQEGRAMTIVTRSAVSGAETFRAIRGVVASIDPERAVSEIVVSDQMQAALGDPRRWSAIVGSFAAAGALLAAVGIFGLMSYVVRQRRRELGVRLALGAEPGALVQHVVRTGMTYVAIGAVIGLALTVMEARWLRALLYGVTPGDPVTIAAATAVLLALAAAACWLPGLAAARIRPLEALAAE